MEGLFHLYAKQLHPGRAIFLLDHYTAGVILFEEADTVRQNSLRRVMFFSIPLSHPDLKMLTCLTKIFEMCYVCRRILFM